MNSLIFSISMNLSMSYVVNSEDGARKLIFTDDNLDLSFVTLFYCFFHSINYFITYLFRNGGLRMARDDEFGGIFSNTMVFPFFYEHWTPRYSTKRQMAQYRK